MPQDPNDPYGLGLKPAYSYATDLNNPDDPYGLGLKPVSATPEPQSWGSFGLNTFLRTAPPVGLGMMFGPPGAAAGGAIGDVLGQGQEYLTGRRTEYNPYETALNAGLGYIPGGIFGEATTRLGSAALSGLEGGLVNAAATPFQHLAATGSMNAPPSEYLANAGMGLGMGGVLGGALHNLPSMKSMEPVLPKTEIPPQPTDISTRPIPPPTPPPTMPGAEALPPRVYKARWTAADLAEWQAKGYVGGGVDAATGQSYMEQGPELRARMSGTPAQPQATPVRQQQALSAFGPAEVPYEPGQDIVIPKAQATGIAIKNLGKRGYVLSEHTPDGQWSIFKQVAEPEVVAAQPPSNLPAEQQIAQATAQEAAQPSPFVESVPRVPPEQDPLVLRLRQQLEATQRQYPQAQEPEVDLGPTPTMEALAPELPQEPTRELPPQAPPTVKQQIDAYGQAQLNVAKSMGRSRDMLDAEGKQRFDMLVKTEQKRILSEGPKFEPPQEMRVPGVKEGKGGLENVAMGGASTRVLDVVGSSMYSRPGPITTIKELLQNAFDEHKQMKIQEPVRVLIDSAARNPVAQGGPSGKSITVRDRGRGVTPEQIYTVLTNLGETGKAGIDSAAGGFGFAKAAPFLGGKYATITSVVDTPKGRMRYTFKGNPFELKNQARGVALNAEKVSTDVPTGLEITTWYDADARGFWQVEKWAKNMTERSPSVEGGIKIAEDYGASPSQARRWLDETAKNPIPDTEYNYPKSVAKEYHAQPMPTLMDTINVPGSEIKIHYDIEPGLETSGVGVHLTNKGMYQGTTDLSYGESTGNVPRSIVTDINAVVEEGHPDYPFTSNREQVSDDVTGAINKWIKDNIITGVTQKRIAEVQKMYDDILPLHPAGLTGMHYLDEGNLLTPDELHTIASHPIMVKALQAMEAVQRGMMDIADTLGWTPESYGATWTKPSERLKKFGILFKAPDSNGTTLGIHIPRPDDMNNSSILINLFEHLNDANKHATPIDQLVTSLLATIAHEDAHIPGGPHDKGHSYRDAELRSKFGADKTVDWMDELGGHFDDGTGKLDPEILRLLQIYNDSRTRASGGANALLATGISRTGQPPTGRGTPTDVTGARPGEAESEAVRSEAALPGGMRGTKGKKRVPSLFEELWGLPTAATTIADVSPVGRQGLPLIFTKEWRQALGPAFRAGISDEASRAIDADLRKLPVNRERRNTITQEILPSHAELAGVKLIEDNKVSASEAGFMSNLIETGGNIPGFSKVYRATYGQVAKASNRFYATFLNHLRSNTLQRLMDDARNMSMEAGTTGSARPGLFKKDFTEQEAADLNPYFNVKTAREIGDFVNTATGRAPMKTYLPIPIKNKAGNIQPLEVNMESSANALRWVMFAPRNLASKVRMLNPLTYTMASPFVRKQYLKAAISTGTAWFTVAELAKLSPNVSVSSDPDSADFGKIRIQNTRLDPGGGFQQFLVAMHRLWSGGYTSSATGEWHRFGEGFQAQSQSDALERFFVNKLNPMTKFGYDLLNASQYQPFQVWDRTAQMYVSLTVQDLMELVKEDPKLLPMMVPIAAGMGSQTYTGGESISKFINPENDWTITGGGIKENLWGP